MKSVLLPVLLLILSCACQPDPTITPTAPSCDAVQNLPPDSPQAQRVVQNFISDFSKAWPTEYMDFSQLWAVDQFDSYVLLQGMITDEARGIILIQNTEAGYQMVARFPDYPHPTRQQVLDYFREEVPAKLFAMIQCIDFLHLEQ